eukprot:54723-Pyramimonas_sp.AAC.1
METAVAASGRGGCGAACGLRLRLSIMVRHRCNPQSTRKRQWWASWTTPGPTTSWHAEAAEWLAVAGAVTTGGAPDVSERRMLGLFTSR